MTKRQVTKKDQGPESFQETRTVIRVLCGWCATLDHKNCKREMLWYEKHYVCSCSCADDFHNELIKTEKGA